MHLFGRSGVDFLDPSQKASSSSGKRNRIDYREVLSEEEFAIYSRLRDLRKSIAESEAVPVYAVFTNQQLADIVQRKVTSKSGLKEIPGLGDARISKYGDRIIESLNPENADGQTKE